MKKIRTGDVFCKESRTCANALQFSERTLFRMQHTMSSRPTLGACPARVRAS